MHHNKKHWGNIVTEFPMCGSVHGRSPTNFSAFSIMPMGVAWKESTSNVLVPPPPNRRAVTPPLRISPKFTAKCDIIWSKAGRNILGVRRVTGAMHFESFYHVTTSFSSLLSYSSYLSAQIGNYR